MKKFSIFAVAGAIAVTATVAFAAVTFDPVTGEGFVGKGEVQEAFGWNNRALQNNADDVQFRYVGTIVEVTDYSWTCTNTSNDNTLERGRVVTETTSLQGVFSHTARERNQITGFILDGWDGTPQMSITTRASGQQLWQCATGWEISDQITDVGDPVETGGGLQASFEGGAWVSLQ
jgi:hypothetical protein